MEENTEYYPELVPVFETHGHAANIRIEDLVEYATSNRCYLSLWSKQVLPETISLSVNESNLFTDIDLY